MIRYLLLALLLPLAACVTAPHPGRWPGPCRVLETIPGGSPREILRYTWSEGRIQTQQTPEESVARRWLGPVTWLQPRRAYGVSTFLLTTTLHDHTQTWHLSADTEADALQKFTVDDAGRVTSLEGRALRYTLDRDGQITAIATDCNGEARAAWWRLRDDGRVHAIDIDMGSGLIDTRYVYQDAGEGLTRIHALRRGAGRTSASLDEVLTCAPWSDGPRLYTAPAPADVTAMVEVAQQEHHYNEQGWLAEQRWWPTVAHGPLPWRKTFRYDAHGNLMYETSSLNEAAPQVTQYSYECWATAP
jgi:hypothetical protein